MQTSKEGVWRVASMQKLVQLGNMSLSIAMRFASLRGEYAADVLQCRSRLRGGNWHSPRE